ncbi:hypothetical protein JI435_419540 [Parastagonospora nodorum SN15]|uniref:Uncharacterized protein n=1 Tax=Phaeosphaeria nodorum (strain SN15 / ATCC MYA-4574 / FGSC 10173) TaxID=321614 RepID=A0A7U2FDT7_PHANO|nr:hypothetical protein JI435_419540 [Parastagonospora nodorum SN15]
MAMLPSKRVRSNQPPLDSTGLAKRRWRWPALDQRSAR